MSRFSSAPARTRLRWDRCPVRAPGAQVRAGGYTSPAVAIHIDSTRSRGAWPRQREALAAPAVAVVTLIAAAIGTHAAGVRFRDPDNVAAKYVVIMIVAVLALVLLDVAIRAGRRDRTWRPSRAAMG